MIAVIIPYYKGVRFLSRCLQSLAASTVELHVYIVDNDPKGLELPEPEVRCTLIRARAGIGYGRAVNIGVSAAMADGASLFIITNQDMVFAPDAINKLVGGLEGKENNAVCIPLILDYDMSAISAHFARRTLASTTYFEDVAGQRTQASYEVRTASGACIALHAWLVEALGLFDPNFPMYGEDDDFFRRLHTNNGRVLLIPEAHVGHWHSLVHAAGEQRKKIDRLSVRARLMLSASDWRSTPIITAGRVARGLLRIGRDAGWYFALVQTLPLVVRVAFQNARDKQGIERLKRRIARHVRKDLRND